MSRVDKGRPIGRVRCSSCVYSSRRYSSGLSGADRSSSLEKSNSKRNWVWRDRNGASCTRDVPWG